MSKIVAVWGEPGAGKSTFSAALAQRLSNDYNAVLVVNPDPIVPAFSMWGVDKDDIPSIGETLNYPELTQTFIRRNTVVYPDNDKIGLMGYLSKESIERHDPIERNSAKKLLNLAKEFAEITIVDCCLPQTDTVSYEAIFSADAVITLVEPNGRGIGFYFSMSPIFSYLEKADIQHAFSAAKIRGESPLTQAEEVIGKKFDAKLPFVKEALDHMDERNLFVKYAGVYQKEIDRLAERIKAAVKNE